MESTQSSDSLSARAPKVERTARGNSVGLMNSASKSVAEKAKPQSEADNSSLKTSKMSNPDSEKPKNSVQITSTQKNAK